MKQIVALIIISVLFIVSDGNAAVVQSSGDMRPDTFVSGAKYSSKSQRKSSTAKKKDKQEKSISAKKADAEKDDEDEKSPERLSEQKNPSQSSTKDAEEDDDEDNKKTSLKSKKQNSNAGYGYAKKYANKLFKTYSGHITIEQENIPSRLGVTVGSTIQFNLKETPDAIWSVELDEEIGKILLNKAHNNQRTLVIETIAEGNMRIFLDNISIKDSKYRVLFKKKMSLLVDE